MGVRTWVQRHAGIDNLGVRVGRMRRGAGRRDACMPACARAHESYIIFRNLKFDIINI